MSAPALAAMLADLSSDELWELLNARDQAPDLAQRVLDYLDHVAEWELHRRAGRRIRLGELGTATERRQHVLELFALVMLARAFSRARRHRVADVLWTVLEELEPAPPTLSEYSSLRPISDDGASPSIHPLRPPSTAAAFDDAAAAGLSSSGEHGTMRLHERTSTDWLELRHRPPPESPGVRPAQGP